MLAAVEQVTDTDSESDVPKGKKYFTPEELVERWEGKIKPKTLANWRSSAAQKGGPPYLKSGGRILYPVGSTLAWEAKHIFGV